MYVAIAEWIAAYNENLAPGEPRMTLTRLAIGIGVKPSTVCRWAMKGPGHRRVPLEKFPDIARELKIMPLDLLRMPGAMTGSRSYASSAEPAAALTAQAEVKS